MWRLARYTYLALALMALSPASGDTGVGEAPRQQDDILDDLHAQPMSSLGRNSFRFSSQPALGGRGFIIEIAAHGQGAAVRVKWAYGHPALGWQQTRARVFRISRDEFDGLMRSIDEDLADAEPPIRSVDPNDPEYGEVMLVCTDGPGYLAERNSNGEISWLSGFCGDRHPNELIASRLIYWVFDRVGE